MVGGCPPSSADGNGVGVKSGDTDRIVVPVLCVNTTSCTLFLLQPVISATSQFVQGGVLFYPHILLSIGNVFR